MAMCCALYIVIIYMCVCVCVCTTAALVSCGSMAVQQVEMCEPVQSVTVTQVGDRDGISRFKPDILKGSLLRELNGKS